jgi:hypothetical protein
MILHVQSIVRFRNRADTPQQGQDGILADKSLAEIPPFVASQDPMSGDSS